MGSGTRPEQLMTGPGDILVEGEDELQEIMAMDYHYYYYDYYYYYHYYIGRFIFIMA